ESLPATGGTMPARAQWSRFRYAPPLAAAPVHNAIVFVALAGIGGTPVNNNAGNAMKLPPPATELSAPPSNPATKRKGIVSKVKQLGVSKTPRCRQTHLLPSRTSLLTKP